MSDIAHTEVISAANQATSWFKNPAFWVGPEHYSTIGIVPSGEGYNGGTLYLEAAIVSPDTDPNDEDVELPAPAIQRLPEYAWSASHADPQKVVVTLPWLRLRTEAAAPELEVFVY